MMQHHFTRVFTILATFNVLATISVGFEQCAKSTPSLSTVQTEKVVDNQGLPGDKELLDNIFTLSKGETFVTEAQDNEKFNYDGKEEEKYDPMGLQIWSDDESFLQALDRGRLVLVIITASWCDKGIEDMLSMASQAAEWIDHLFLPSSSNSDNYSNNFSEQSDFKSNLFHCQSSLNPSLLLRKPLIGTMESSSVSPTLMKSLGSVSVYPALKCILTSHSEIGNGEEQINSEHSENSPKYEEDEMLMWDYIGSRESAKDLFDSILMYWYRFVVSNALMTHQSECVHSSLGPRIPNYEEKIETRKLMPPIFSFTSEDQLEIFTRHFGEFLLRPAQARLRYQAKNKIQSDVFKFYMGGFNNDISGVFHHFTTIQHNNDTDMIEQRNQRDNKNENHYFIQEIDPFVLLVQCRMSNNSSIYQMKAKTDFDELAEEMVHRSDVAFFTVEETPEGANDITKKSCNRWFRESGEKMDGEIAVLRVQRYVTFSIEGQNKPERDNINDTHYSFLWNQQLRKTIHNITTDWNTAFQSSSHASFIPSSSIMPNNNVEEKNKKIFMQDSMNSTQYILSKMIPFIVIHTTPTVLWFDRHRTAQFAFPWYRKVHAVLFVDIGLSHKHLHPSYSETSDNSLLDHPPWPSTIEKSIKSAKLLVEQQRSIQLFYNAALHHRMTHPSEDVVFLIVPSSETRIMTKFGVDIWTPLDEAIFNSTKGKVLHVDQDNPDARAKTTIYGENVEYCSSRDNHHGRDILPLMMITDSSKQGTQLSRYYLCSNDIKGPSSIAFSHGGPIGSFLQKFFNGTNGKPFFRSENSESHSLKPKENRNSIHAAEVTVLTGNRFESMVMKRDKKHSMVLLQTLTCGHCKRFSIFWNEFASLVYAMNWSSVIDVMKMDVSKNDIPHAKVDARDVPCVYYFPAGEKDDPIEIKWVGQATNPQQEYEDALSWVNSGYDLVEWIVKQGKLDLELLIKLDELKNSDIQEKDSYHQNKDQV